jgi:hypothetical protein
MNIKKIISGGQTGADRAALDWAIKNQVAHGGWCPQGRKAEDGIIAPYYALEETPSEDYAQRTEWNIRDSEGTVIFSIYENLSGGSLLTKSIAKQQDKPYIHIYQERVEENQTVGFYDFLKNFNIQILNVAGVRASEDIRIYQFVINFLNYSLLIKS